MTEQIKTDFEKIVKTSAFSEKDVELKKMYLNKFLETGFPNRKLENWKFSDLSQIIKKNIGELSFYNDYSLPNKVDTSIFVEGLEHNKIIFINVELFISLIIIILSISIPLVSLYSLTILFSR